VPISSVPALLSQSLAATAEAAVRGRDGVWAADAEEGSPVSGARDGQPASFREGIRQLFQLIFRAGGKNKLETRHGIRHLLPTFISAVVVLSLVDLNSSRGPSLCFDNKRVTVCHCQQAAEAAETTAALCHSNALIRPSSSSS